MVEDCVGFDWDKGNAFKNWDKHCVTPLECEQIFFNEPLLIADTEKHGSTEKRFFALGKTDRERLLFVVFTVRLKKIRIISARPMSKAERKGYEAL